MPLAVRLGKCESNLIGGTEYDGFKRLSLCIENKVLSECKSWC